ncbi:hypothetical protein OF83DRAFT_1126117 [Amylostereum chailletii]|nr:hypothetical protein OF83DRAFT_1126117 [Amylostereum chailletii]
MSPIKIGFVGLSATGGWAATALHTPLAHPDLASKYALTAVSTSSEASAKASAEKYGAAGAYHGATDAIAGDPNVDLVVVSVKAPDHKKAVLPAIAKGKDVFVEWPLGNGLAEAREIAQAASEKGVKTIVGLQSWQVPAIRKIKEWIAEGKIGKVLSASWLVWKDPSLPFYSPWTTPAGLYAIYPENGATFPDILIGHNLSFILYALGPLASVSATTATTIPTVKVAASADAPDAESQFVPVQVPDQWAFTGTLADSGALLTASWRTLASAPPAQNALPPLTFVVEGTKGQIRVESDRSLAPQVHGVERVFLNGAPVDLAAENAVLGSSTGRAWAEFAKGADAGGVYPTFEDAVGLHQHVEAIKVSAREGRRVEVSQV